MGFFLCACSQMKCKNQAKGVNENVAIHSSFVIITVAFGFHGIFVELGW